jgi:hypothetical protein
MSVREITCNDLGAYLDFRKKLWPGHASAGCWEIVITKYFQNPHRAQCPGSGLYGYFHGARLVGTMGAYPMPVTLKDTAYPGHMLVDWAVLPEFRFGPVAGQLWGKLISLPGRKFGSVGTQFSQAALEKRAKKIPACEATGLLSMSSGIAAKLLQPKQFSLASPLHLDELEIVPGVTLIEPCQVRGAVPVATAAHVYRDADFWQVFCESRLFNGAFPVRIVSEGEADIVLRLSEMGRFRFCTLLCVHLAPYTVAHARMTGRVLRNFLRRLKVGVLYATEADEQLKAVVESTCRFVRRSEVYWWSIPTRSDTFRHDEVSWWLTSADRDSIYGGVQPFDPR